MTGKRKILIAAGVVLLFLLIYASVEVVPEGTHVPIHEAPEQEPAAGPLSPERLDEIDRQVEEIKKGVQELDEMLKRLEKEGKMLNEQIRQYHQGTLKAT